MKSRVPSSVADRNAAVACEVGAAITMSLDLDNVLTFVARRIAEAVGVTECDLYEFYPESGVLVAAGGWAADWSPADEAWVGTTFTCADRPAFAAVVLDRQTTEIHSDDRRLDADDRTRMDAAGERSILTVPLVTHDQVVGCLTLLAKRAAHCFTADDRDLVEKLSLPAAVAVSNARVFRHGEEQNRQLAALLDSTRAITTTIVLEDVLDLVGRKTAEALGSPQCVIYEYDAEADSIIFRAIHDKFAREGRQDAVGTVYSLDDYPDDRVVLTSARPIQERLSRDDVAARVGQSMGELGEQACLNVPLIYRGEPVGILVLIETECERVFTAAEIDLAQALGEQVSLALQHARLYRRQETQNRRLMALLETSRAMTASLDAQKVLDYLRAEIAVLFELPVEAVATDASQPLLDAPCGRSRHTPAPAESTIDDGRPRLMLPMVLKNDLQGCVDVAGRTGQIFTPDQVELAQVLANQAAVAVENARLYEAIEQQAITDGLTGLYNHRYFYERLFQEVGRAQRYGLDLSLLMLDVDDFKGFNDRYGHPFGDQVLRRVAGILQQELRYHVDLAARYGGEEFAVLLPETPLSAAGISDVTADQIAGQVRPVTTAFAIGEHLCRLVAQTSFAADEGSAELTVSIGIAALPMAAADPEELVRQADKALYVAKRRGKNRVELYRP